MDHYDVFWKRRVVGSVSIATEGLYYRISCRCTPEEGMYKLIAICGSTSFPIGVCMPQGAGYVLNKKIPVKQLCEEIKAFYLVSRDSVDGRLVPVSSEKPFAAVLELENARFEEHNGCPCIRIMTKETLNRS